MTDLLLLYVADQMVWLHLLSRLFWDSTCPNIAFCGFHDKGDIRKDFLYNATLAHCFWLSWMKAYIHSLQGRNKLGH